MRLKKIGQLDIFTGMNDVTKLLVEYMSKKYYVVVDEGYYKIMVEESMEE